MDPALEATFLTFDTLKRIATFQLAAGTELLDQISFNGARRGARVLTVPVGWRLGIEFTNRDDELPHSATVVASIDPIPEQLPALRNMPGFESVSRGQRIECSYRWTAFAREGTYTIGTPGTSMPVGGGEIYDSGTISFSMRKPGTSTGGDDACIP